MPVPRIFNMDGDWKMPDIPCGVIVALQSRTVPFVDARRDVHHLGISGAARALHDDASKSLS